MTLQQTSLLAYDHALKNLGVRQNQVLRALKEAGPLTNRELSRYMELEINTITPRIQELRKAGLVQQAGHKIDITGRRAILWEVVYPRELF